METIATWPRALNETAWKTFVYKEIKNGTSNQFWPGIHPISQFLLYKKGCTNKGIIERLKGLEVQDT